jgi:VCBS repeat-containing protein
MFSKNLLIALCCAVFLSGCNFSDDDPAPNTAPTAMTVDLITQADIAIMDSLPASDAENDVLSFSLVTDAQNGTLVIESNGQYVYTPNATFTGTDSFEFSVTDGVNMSVNGAVNITIESQVVGFASYSREVFAQEQDDEPLPINGREFTQDVSDPTAYDDLLQQP